MYSASAKYKKEMRQKYRDGLNLLRVTIGVVNQEAQASASVLESGNYAYYSDLKRPLDNYRVEELYAVCDQDYTPADGTVYFLPRKREDVVLNAGIVTAQPLGAVEIRFPVAYDIKGLTVDFGKAYPVDFSIESDSGTVNIQNNSDVVFVTDEIFSDATFLRFVPKRMVNGQGRLRIHQITMGIGIYFDNKKIKTASKKEHISPISEELPTLDFQLTIENKDRTYDVENAESTLNFLEPGQAVEILYGQELDDKRIEWIPGARAFLREWSADDDEMSFSASDRFEDLGELYRRGKYSSEGISLYDLAVDVLNDAGVDSREYWLDDYLKNVKVYNPMPVVSHREALQLIANAGRCILYQNRSGNIVMKSSFIPDMEAGSSDEAYFSRVASILEKTDKQVYATTEKDHTDVSATQFFLPRSGDFLEVGYVSDCVSDEGGIYEEPPKVWIDMESSYKCFGITLEFGRNHPLKMIFHSYLGGELQEDFVTDISSDIFVLGHEFPEMNRLEMEFLEGAPQARVSLQRVAFGDSTDYELSYGAELTKTPKGTQLSKVKELQVVRTIYTEGTELRQLAKEIVPDGESRHTFYLNAPSHGYAAETADGVSIPIIDSSAYYVTVEAASGTEVVVTGSEFSTTQTATRKELNVSGTVEMWENPLVSSSALAADLAEWIGDYLRSDREYDLTYRGEPRIDANDIAFLENKYVPDLLLRIYEHTLKFNGALSGTIKARRDMTHVGRTKNKLETGGFL